VQPASKSGSTECQNSVLNLLVETFVEFSSLGVSAVNFVVEGSPFGFLMFERSSRQSHSFCGDNAMALKASQSHLTRVVLPGRYYRTGNIR